MGRCIYLSVWKGGQRLLLGYIAIAPVFVLNGWFDGRHLDQAFIVVESGNSLLEFTLLPLVVYFLNTTQLSADKPCQHRLQRYPCLYVC